MMGRSSLSRILAVGALSLTAPSAFAADADTPFYLNSTHWAFVTLLIFLFIVWRLGAFKAVGGLLDKRANEIESELNQAKAMREEASRKLEEVERKQVEANELAATIVAQAEADAKALVEQAEKDLADMVVRREKQVEMRIARAEEEATQAVKSVAVDAATKAAADILKSSADQTKGADAFKTALASAKAAVD